MAFFPSKKNSVILSKKLICEILGLPAPATDETYTKIFFAHEVGPGGVAILSINTSVVRDRTTPQRQAELADLAMQRGAKLLISTVQIKDYPCLIVDDMLDAFCKVVRYVRSQYNPRTIAITGSIGKTTTTQMVYSVISYKYNTHRNDSSANNLRLAAGIIQNLKSEHKYYVQETMEGPPFGAASDISKIVLPQAAIVTVVGSSHMESFGSQEKILESCLGVQDGMPDDGLLILNGDDPFQWGAKTRLKKVYYAIDNEKADYRAVNIHSDGNQLLFDIVHDGKKTPIALRCFGIHNVLNAVAAFAAGKWANMRDQDVAAGLHNFRTEGIRQNFVHIGGKNLFLDCYNAAPESIKSALDSLMMIPVKAGGRRIAVLADIKEAGEKEKAFHVEVGKMVATSSIDYLVCYGKLSRLIAAGVLTNSSIPVFHTEKQEELVDFLLREVTDDDVVLFKGSHSMALEHAVDLAYGTWYHEVYDLYEYRTRNSEDDDLRYRIFPDHVAVIEKRSSKADVVIPPQIGSVPVTSIGTSAFAGSKSLRSVSLPNSLINIRYHAFSNTALHSVVIPAGTKIIGEGAFSGCKELQSVEIGNGCTHIAYRAFADCGSLARITIPSSVQTIRNDVFLHCSAVKIYGVPGSCAQRYAEKNGIAFETISAAGSPSGILAADADDSSTFLRLVDSRREDLIRYVKDNEQADRDAYLREHYLKGYTGKIVPKVTPLSEEQLKEIEACWGKYYKAGLYNPAWNAIYSSVTGKFDPYYVPQDLHYLFVERSKLERNYQIAFSDKNYLSLLFPTIKKPQTVVRKIKGFYYDESYNPITAETAREIIQANLRSGLVAKKSRESCAGRGVTFFTPQTTQTEINEVLNAGNELQIQLCVHQHKALEKLNPTSVNTIRLMTVIVDGKAELLSGVVRIGNPGSRVDNFSRGGFCCGIREDGSLTEYGYQDNGTRHLVHPLGYRFADNVIPNYQSIVETVKRQHYYIPMLGLVSWDICVGEDGEAVLIEINIGEGQIDLHQYNNGPIYGELREKLLSQAFENYYSLGATLDFSYRCYLDRAVIEKGSRALKEICFPDTIQGLPLSRIGSNAFSESPQLQAVYFPQSVRSIGSAAFFSCRKLHTVHFGNGLISIERSAFNECMALKEVRLPASLKTIGRRAFWDCHSLVDIYIPSSVSSIDEEAFGHSAKAVIHCEANSFAESYAKKNRIPFIIEPNW